MSFLETVRRVKVYLEEQRSVSLRALEREFGLADGDVEVLAEELTEVQQVAVRKGQILTWTGSGSQSADRGPGTELPTRKAGTYTPKHLADKILQSRSALEGERKQVTVLFADVKGSMELAEQLDPEEWHRILDRFFQILTDGIHRFEGTVNQYTGDGIMALFGAPIAHEDHAQRACYAALHLRDELRGYAEELKRSRGLSFAVRMGINSGEVVVGKIGDDLRMDYTAQGHTIGLAQRMEQLADPGAVYLAERTGSLVGGYFALRDLGRFNIKGAREAAQVYELEGVASLRTRLDRSRERGFSRLVGRDAEMKALDTVHKEVRQGSGQVIGIVGEAGVGKSRLCYEFLQHCRAGGTPVYEAHCVAHGRLIPFLPVLELMRNYFGITERDSSGEARTKIAGTIVLLDPGLQQNLPLVFDFLGVPDPDRPAPQLDPDARGRRLSDLIRRMGEVRSMREPAVFFVDDLHWVDNASEAYLAIFAASVVNSRGLLLVNFRPEYRGEWLRRSSYEQIPLRPLEAAATGSLIAELLGPDPSVVALAEHLAQRSGGNPFFAEEVVLALAESGTLAGAAGRYRLVGSVEDVSVPASVQAIIAARIDRLEEREKTVVQAASVIGKTFSEDVLGEVLGMSAPDLAGALARLTGAGFIYERELYPTAEYGFKHPLSQEVAYRSQLSDQRMGLHTRIADLVSDLYADRRDDKAALVAHHWEQAGQPLKAAQWLSRAAEWAGGSQVEESTRYWSKVRELLQSVPESSESMSLGAEACINIVLNGSRMGAPEDELATTFLEGLTLARGSGDRRALCEFLSTYIFNRVLFATIGREELRPVVEEARALAGEVDDVGTRMWAFAAQSMFEMFWRSVPRSLELANTRRARRTGRSADASGSAPPTGSTGRVDRRARSPSR
jgi:class 3 adenylate cyclase